MDRFRNTRQPDRDWWRQLWPDPDAVLRQLGLGADTSVADVGCGDGYFALPAAELVAPATVYAVDLDAGLLADLEADAAAAGSANVETVEGDARRLDELLPAPVDAALVANTFHGVEDPATFAGTVARALRPGGRLLVVNWHDRPREETPVAGEPRGPPTEFRLSPAATVEAVAPAGFEPAATVDLPPHHYGLVLER